MIMVSIKKYIFSESSNAFALKITVMLSHKRNIYHKPNEL